MDEDDFFRLRFLDVGQQCLARGVSAEVETLHVALQFLRRKIGIHGDEIAGRGGFDFSTGRIRVRVTDEEERMPRLAQDAAGEAVREGFLRHHAAGEREDAALADGRIAALAVEHERRDVVEDLQIVFLSWCLVREFVVDFCELGAEAADVNGRHAEQAAAAEFVKHREDLLRLAEREERDEHAAAALEHRADRARKTNRLFLTGEIRRRGAVAARGLDDEHVERLLWKVRPPPRSSGRRSSRRRCRKFSCPPRGSASPPNRGCDPRRRIPKLGSAPSFSPSLSPSAEKRWRSGQGCQRFTAFSTSR